MSVERCRKAAECVAKHRKVEPKHRKHRKVVKQSRKVVKHTGKQQSSNECGNLEMCKSVKCAKY